MTNYLIERNKKAEEAQIKDCAIIICDFLQTKKVKLSKIYNFLKKKEPTIKELNSVKNQFLSYCMRGTKTAIIEEFFKEVK